MERVDSAPSLFLPSILVPEETPVQGAELLRWSAAGLLILGRRKGS